MAWHQVTNKSANANVSEVLANTSVNVVSPTWFYMDDNQGGIANLASSSYVDYCHGNNIKVWALFSNLENKNVDTATVLNITS
jgi:spore germination protein YaaH